MLTKNIAKINAKLNFLNFLISTVFIKSTASTFGFLNVNCLIKPINPLTTPPPNPAIKIEK